MMEDRNRQVRFLSRQNSCFDDSAHLVAQRNGQPRWRAIPTSSPLSIARYSSSPDSIRLNFRRINSIPSTDSYKLSAQRSRVQLLEVTRFGTILEASTTISMSLSSRKSVLPRPLTHPHLTPLPLQTVRFPPLKARPSSEQPAAPLHSPISPLSPSSPLYPDGIIAPIWIRKHREMVPAVFLLALRLFEFIPPAETVAGPLDGNLAALREEQERKHDAELVKEIIERRRTTVERGIKLAVVLLCSRPLLDSSSLDARLSQIRRQSTLDSRASLFVISPVEIAEVENFVESLRRELWDAALDYYREHGRRVRRKRARSLSGKGGLGEKGWTVRYDYKMGFMAEMRGEIEVSLKYVVAHPVSLLLTLTRPSQAL